MIKLEKLLVSNWRHCKRALEIRTFALLTNSKLEFPTGFILKLLESDPPVPQKPLHSMIILGKLRSSYTLPTWVPKVLPQ